MVNNMDKKSREHAIEELSLMLLYLTRFQDNNEFCRYMEASWKGYDFDVLNKLEQKELLYQPKKSKCVYLSEEGKLQARKLLNAYGLADKELMERFEFRSIEETEQAIIIEQICFPLNEACSEKSMKDRIATAPELFLVAVDNETGKLAGFLNGLSTNENLFQDEFFTNANLYNPIHKSLDLLILQM